MPGTRFTLRISTTPTITSHIPHNDITPDTYHACTATGFSSFTSKGQTRRPSGKPPPQLARMKHLVLLRAKASPAPSPHSAERCSPGRAPPPLVAPCQRLCSTLAARSHHLGRSETPPFPGCNQTRDSRISGAEPQTPPVMSMGSYGCGGTAWAPRAPGETQPTPGTHCSPERKTCASPAL